MLQFTGDGSDGIIEISGSDWDIVNRAKDTVLQLVAEPEVGKTYE